MKKNKLGYKTKNIQQNEQIKGLYPSKDVKIL